MKFTGEIKKTDYGVIIKPCYASDAEELARLKQNTQYRFNVKQPRNNRFTRLAFAAVRLGFANQESVDNFEAYRQWITIEAGFYQAYHMRDKVWIVPDSWSESAKDQIDFEALYNGVVDILVRELQTAPQDIRDNLENFM